eukprot:CAMPEP_0198253882 /NCGR_PEP_ID=MMETSP1447-20131203/4266_1 /TAXON_ID=420782 /ORGANISM="Chaetoceros dichaeta, Strain CCMP1751" /LENGTH=63 /DNA_ID=CAMNT_0043939725 /DNA_START=26 /DNA_END=214 /DNA_ORIENTATION=+
MHVANFFKELNEKNSHDEGDKALEFVAMQIKKVAQILPGAKAYHSGGDKFQLLAQCQGNDKEF